VTDRTLYTCIDTRRRRPQVTDRTAIYTHRYAQTPTTPAATNSEVTDRTTAQIADHSGSQRATHILRGKRGRSATGPPRTPPGRSFRRTTGEPRGARPGRRAGEPTPGARKRPPHPRGQSQSAPAAAPVTRPPAPTLNGVTRATRFDDERLARLDAEHRTGERRGTEAHTRTRNPPASSHCPARLAPRPSVANRTRFSERRPLQDTATECTERAPVATRRSTANM
jgi:hypothetical protein